MDHIQTEELTPGVRGPIQLTEEQKLIECHEAVDSRGQLHAGEGRMQDTGKASSVDTESKLIDQDPASLPDFLMPTMPQLPDNGAFRSVNNHGEYARPIEQTKPLVFSRKVGRGEASNDKPASRADDEDVRRGEGQKASGSRASTPRCVEFFVVCNG